VVTRPVRPRSSIADSNCCSSIRMNVSCTRLCVQLSKTGSGIGECDDVTSRGLRRPRVYDWNTKRHFYPDLMDLESDVDATTRSPCSSSVTRSWRRQSTTSSSTVQQTSAATTAAAQVSCQSYRYDCMVTWVTVSQFSSVC